MSQPQVSIVLPTYKRAHLLAQAMQSVLDQTYTNLELIIVDDNSPDNTAEVVSAFNDSRIQYVKNDPNLKLPRALNRGFSLARGDYLTWTSDDNLLAPTAIEKMVARLGKGDCDFVYADYWLFSEQDANGNPLDPQHDRLPDVLQLEKGNHIGACFMYTRKVYAAIGEYDPELLLVEDYDYFLRAARQFKFSHIDEPLYYFRRDDATLYISRFPEVKTSDVLVRFKNDAISVAAAATTLTHLLLQHPGHLTDTAYRRALVIRDRFSYRIGNWFVQRAARHLNGQIENAIAPLFENFKRGETSFAESRTALLTLTERHGKLAYRAPKT